MPVNGQQHLLGCPIKDYAGQLDQTSMLEDFVYSKEQDDFSPSKQLSPDLTTNQLISFKWRYKIDISHLNAGTLKNILGLIFQHLPLWKKIENTLRLIIRHSSESCQFKRLRHTLNVFFGAGKYIFFCICLMNRRKDVKHNIKCSSFKTKYLTALNPISFSDFTSLSISLWKRVEVKTENKKNLKRQKKQPTAERACKIFHFCNL